VVGQLLDYASEAGAGWTAAQLRGWLAERCDQAGLDAEQELADFEPTQPDHESFWRRAEENLRAGNVRLIFEVVPLPVEL
jgi:hypothetical protein